MAVSSEFRSGLIVLVVVVQGVLEKDSPKKGDKAAAKQPEPKKPAGDATAAAASPKTDSKLKKRAEVEMERKFISK